MKKMAKFVLFFVLCNNLFCFLFLTKIFTIFRASLEL